jgi:mRNA interferase MazF
MEKDFAGWSTLKQHLDGTDKIPSFKEREIWWCSVGVNIGFEIFGKGQIYTRPVLVVRKFSRSTFLGIPFTSKHKEKPRCHPVHFGGRDSVALLEQLRAFDSKRLVRKMGTLTDEQFATLRQLTKDMI